MAELRAPGLPADWLNGWLAALGAAVLVPGLRISWTRSAPETPLLASEAGSVPQLIARALPERRDVEQLSIAKEHPRSSRSFKRNANLEDFRARAELARDRLDSTLAATVTDLVAEDEAPTHSPFDPPAPRGETIHDRALRCRSAIADLGGDVAELVAATLEGAGQRVTANGLGFDHRRLPAAAVNTSMTVDPVVELLAFHALWLFPVRGNGRRARARGWTASASTRGAFTWPVWEPALDRWAIDALLDRWYLSERRARAFGVVGAYRSVPFRSRGSSDVTRAYASERS